MKRHRSQWFTLAAALTLILPGVAQAARRERAQPRERIQERVQAPTDAGDSRWAMGFGYLPGPNGALDALSATFSPTPDVDIDGLLLGGTVSNANGGNVSTSAFGLGAQGRFSLLHPSPNLAFQVLGRLSYVSSGNPYGANSSSSQVGLFLGAGFEGYIPAWRAVSVEVNSGFNIGLASYSAGGTTVNSTAISLGASNANAFVPFNLAVHYHF